MKPSRNQVFCPSCRHNKLLFQSKQKADRFIQFNRDEILEETGKAPVRSYYCRLCCGWHVTSNEDDEVGRNLDRRDNKVIRKIDEDRDQSKLAASIKESRGPEISSYLDNVERALLGCDASFAEKVLKRTLYPLYVARRYYPDWQEGCRLLDRGWSLQRVLSALKDAATDADQPETASDATLLDKVLSNKKEVAAFDTRLDAIEHILDAGTADEKTILTLVTILDDLTLWRNKEVRYQKRRLCNRQRQLVDRIKESLRGGDETLGQSCLKAAALLADRAEDLLRSGEKKLGRRYINDIRELLRLIKPTEEKEQLKLQLDSLMKESLMAHQSSENEIQL
jgi:hypothetical protein